MVSGNGPALPVALIVVTMMDVGAELHTLPLASRP